MAATACPVTPWIWPIRLPIRLPISSVARAVWAASSDDAGEADHEGREAEQAGQPACVRRRLPPRSGPCRLRPRSRTLGIQL
jgi:hypothetical protein